MTLKIEEGKYYRTRDGRRTGPMLRSPPLLYVWRVPAGGSWTEHGTYREGLTGASDLVAEWIDEPAPEVEPKSAPLTKRDALEKAIEAVADRGLNYGRPEDNFQRIANLWKAHLVNIDLLGADVLGDAGKGITADDVALMMAMVKIARLENQPNHQDSWVDLAGYAACGAEIACRRD